MNNETTIAISYLRFSSAEQRKGDSKRRQTEAAEAWCERNKVPLDRKLSCIDAGKSAFHGAHRDDKAELGRFLDLVRQGAVPRGSYLIIENLDRLTREDIWTALGLVSELLKAGIRIVQLKPVEQVIDQNSEPMLAMMALVELSRGHSESRMKSERTSASTDQRVNLAREGKLMPPRRADGKITTAITSRLPSWIEEKKGKLCLIEKRAKVIRRIFELCISGYGASSIVKRLNKDNVPAFGIRVKADEGHYQKVDGHPLGCGEWRTSYIRDILSDRRVLGEFQPRDANEKPKGPPISFYYPAVVGKDEFNAARAAVSKRKVKQGAIGKDVANLFGGLMKNARDGDSYYAGCKSDKWGKYRVLLNKTSIESDATAYTFPYAVFEKAVLAELYEIDPADLLGNPKKQANPATLLRDELAVVREDIAGMNEAMRKRFSPNIAQVLGEKEQREAELAEQLADAEERVAVPLSATWANFKSLVDVLDKAKPSNLEDIRLRLRAAIRRIVDEVRILVVPRGRYRMCLAQIVFSGGEYFRNVRIYFRPNWAGAGSKKPGAWYSPGSVLASDVEHSAGGYEQHDLRIQHYVDSEIAAFEGMKPATIKWLDGLLEEQGNPLP